MHDAGVLCCVIAMCHQERSNLKFAEKGSVECLDILHELVARYLSGERALRTSRSRALILSSHYISVNADCDV
jgi:hypothetical protein